MDIKNKKISEGDFHALRNEILTCGQDVMQPGQLRTQWPGVISTSSGVRSVRQSSCLPTMLRGRKAQPRTGSRRVGGRPGMVCRRLPFPKGRLSFPKGKLTFTERRLPLAEGRLSFPKTFRRLHSG